jgi:hypothetical protein
MLGVWEQCLLGTVLACTFLWTKAIHLVVCANGKDGKRGERRGERGRSESERDRGERREEEREKREEKRGRGKKERERERELISF